ncbi:hypothetical protein Tco_0627696 [Tanacetum coccineum]|uniref:Xylulose kinase-1 n=1 Tax=Tanacetum coccineum TaxID=301880 RepID=A0ABQ4WN70_9ASTR
MENLEFCDTHNMVAYLKKPKGSEGFHQIMDFLNASHIRYALTENPTIYVSLIKQFWETATARTLDNREIELTAIIDGKVKIVTGASVRKHLQLADSDGINSLPTTKNFEQLSLMGNMKRASKGYIGENIPLFPVMIVQGPVVQGEGSTYLVESHHTPTSAPSTLQPTVSPTSRRTTRQESMVPQPRSPTQTYVADEAASTGVDVRYGGATTTVTSLEAGQGSGNIDKTPTMPHDLPLPRVNTLRSDEGSMTLQELMVLCTTFSKKVESLETDLKQTKQLYGATFTRLIKKVKKLEKTTKSNQARRRARIMVFDDEDDLEDPSKQGRKIAEIDQDPDISLVQHDVEIQGRYIQGRYGHEMEFKSDFDVAKEVSTAEKDVSTAKPVSTIGAAVTTASVAISTASPTRVSTTNDITMAETLVYIKKSAAKDKGKGKMAESETVQTKTKTKLQQEQERLCFEAAVRLQDELEEEDKQRIARVHGAASSFNVEEWEDIQARVEADEELAQRLQAEEREKYTEAKQARLLTELINQRKRYFAAQKLNKGGTSHPHRLKKGPICLIISRIWESEVDRTVLELAAGSSKKVAEEELDQESSKRQKTGESSELAEEPRDKEADELS